MLDEKQVDMIIKELIKAGAISIGKNSNLFYNIKQIAIKLGYIQSLQSDRMESGIDLEEEDFLKIQDKLWELILKGYLAPGKNEMNPWFPKLHFTEKGEKFQKELIEENEQNK